MACLKVSSGEGMLLAVEIDTSAQMPTSSTKPKTGGRTLSAKARQS